MLSEFEISPMRSNEADAVSALVVRVIESLEYYNDRARAEEIAKYSGTELRKHASDDPASVLVARATHQPVGFCISRYDDGLVWLSWFGVAEQARGSGIGSALLTALEDTLPERRAHKLWCDTRTDNIHSARVLERAGFRRLVSLTNHWYGQDYYLWEKPGGSGG